MHSTGSCACDVYGLTVETQAFPVLMLPVLGHWLVESLCLCTPQGAVLVMFMVLLLDHRLFQSLCYQFRRLVS